MTEKMIVFDTETANSLDDPFFYDIGWAVVDESGEVYRTYSYVNADVFLDDELMQTAYFKDKIPQYWAEIKSGERTLTSFYNIRKAFAECVKEFEIKKAFAHNALFDYRSTNYTQRFLTSSKYRYFFPYGLEICDTLKMARQVLKINEEYENFCYVNNYLTKRGCRRYTAEIIYRFISNNLQFEEEHTGLADVLIEKEILTYCLQKMPNVKMKLWED